MYESTRSNSRPVGSSNNTPDAPIVPALPKRLWGAVGLITAAVPSPRRGLCMFQSALDFIGRVLGHGAVQEPESRHRALSPVLAPAPTRRSLVDISRSHRHRPDLKIA